MMEALTIKKVYKGAWKEMLERREEISESSQVEVLVFLPPEVPSADPEDNLYDAPIEVWEKALDEIAAKNAGIPPLPDEAFSRENIYEDRI
jgi:hypothetical protein